MLKSAFPSSLGSASSVGGLAQAFPKVAHELVSVKQKKV
jgi:hypothetical protein